MELLSAEQVLSLPIDKQEDVHRSRTRHGYHVYLCRNLHHWKYCLSRQQQEQRYSEVMGDFAEDSDGSINSNSSEFYLRQEGIQMNYKKRFKAVVKCWNDMAEDRKQAWRVRARRLNVWNLPGKLYFIPSKFNIVVSIYVSSI